MNKKFTHFDENGNSIMVDVSEKENTLREAEAQGKIKVSVDVFDKVINHNISKGDVLSVAQIAGITGMKKTSDIIPLCHNINLLKCSIKFQLDEKNSEILVVGHAKTFGKTGVEMEALAGVTIALLTIYDMCKAIDKNMLISNICLVKKTGGKSGNFHYSGGDLND
ncbi:cyclic pyranopterin monophosphate synthase MoaC [Fusobacterium sp. PH5-44]|uniref:cyclic pyranopterin monophosphate synthase MoaC n=1 Tax=unclassified Fusobacterium TaxID=2648384 RepID=UPI003D1ED8D6